MNHEQFPATTSSPGHGRWRRQAALWAACVLWGICGVAQAQRPPLTIPARTELVIERLPPGYAKLTPRTGTMTPAQTVAEADTLLAIAARTGDSRLAARADGLLARFPVDTTRTDVMHARTFSAQHRHDFAGALALLDQLVAKEPRDGNARMSRAQINLVQGRLDAARADCVVLILGVDADEGMLCTASLSLRRSQFDTAASMLDRWLSQAQTDDPRRGYALVMRAEVAARAGDPDADRRFTDVLALDPKDVKALASYARYLRAVGRDRDVEPLLAAVDTDTLQLQRTLAAHAMHSPAAPALIEAQARRYETAHAVGSQPEMRDEAEFLLTLRGRADAALALAQRNFASQRDFEDVDILTRAAWAAGKPEALQPLQAWAQAQRILLPTPQGVVR